MSFTRDRALSSRKAIHAAGLTLAVMLLAPMTAQAQLLDKLKGAVGSEGSGQSSGAAGALGGAIPSVAQASPGNTAGVLQYCVKNNYLSGGSATSVKDSLMSKVTGSGNAASDSGYQAGNKGILSTGNGQSFSLGGSGIKAQVTQKVCDQILQHAKSLL